MEFIVVAIDRPNTSELRQALRLPHLEYVASRQKQIKFGGPILSDSGRTLCSLLILSFPTRAELDAHLDGDPYFTGDLFEAVFIRQTRQIVPEQEAGALELELARQREQQNASPGR